MVFDWLALGVHETGVTDSWESMAWSDFSGNLTWQLSTWGSFRKWIKDYVVGEKNHTQNFRVGLVGIFVFFCTKRLFSPTFTRDIWSCQLCPLVTGWLDANEAIWIPITFSTAGEKTCSLWWEVIAVSAVHPLWCLWIQSTGSKIFWKEKLYYNCTEFFFSLLFPEY